MKRTKMFRLRGNINFFIILLVGIFSFLLFSCNTGSNLTQVEKVSNNTYMIDLGNRAKKGLDINVKITFPSFSIKAFKERKFVKEIKSLKVHLVKNNISPLVAGNIIASAILNVNQGENIVYNLQFKNVDPGGGSLTYWAAVQAYDLPNAGGNEIQASSTEGAIVSTNSATVNPGLGLSFSGTEQELIISLALQDALGESAPFGIYSSNPTSLNNLDLSTDNIGNGLVVWQQNTIELGYRQLKDFIPGLTNSTLNLADSTNALSLATNNDGKGLLAYTKINGATRSIAAKAITNHTTFGSETIFGQVTNKLMSKPHISINSKGDGLVVWHSDQDNANTSIYGRSIVNYNPGGLTSGFQIFRDDTTIKEFPRISLNEQGDGVVTWQEKKGAGVYEVFMIPLKSFDVPEYNGTGLISTLNTNNIVTGTGTAFKRELEVGSRIFCGAGANAQIFTVASVLSDTSFIATLAATFNHINVPFTGKGINRTLSGTISTIASDNTIIGNSTFFNTELRSGNRIKVWTNPGNVLSDELVVALVLNNQNFFGFPAPNNNCNGCTYTVKDDSQVSLQDITKNSQYPNIQLNSSGDGIIVWKDQEPFGPSTQNSIKYSQIQNFQLSGNENVIANDSNPGAGTILNDGVDKAPPGISLNGQGDGLVTWSHVNGSGRVIHVRKVVNFVPTGGVISGSLADSIEPVISLNRDGDGILAFVRLSLPNYFIQLEHFISYLP